MNESSREPSAEPDRTERKPVSDPGEEEADFASEHTSPTFADQQRGGQEESPEPETPQGYAGMDRGRFYRRREAGADDAQDDHEGEG